MPGPDAAYERYLALRIRRWAGFDHEHRPVMSPLLESHSVAGR